MFYSCFKLAGTHSHLEQLWEAEFLDTETSLSDFSAVLGAVGALWPSWTHFTDSAAAHSVDMFTHSWFRLDKNEGGGGGGGGWWVKGDKWEKVQQKGHQNFLGGFVHEA